MPPEAAPPPPASAGGGLSLRQMLEREGLLLAAVSAGGTLSAYLFQFGYLDYYGVPMEFIELDIIRIITATAFSLLSFFIFFVAFSLISDVIESAHEDFRSLLALSIGILVLALPLFLMSGASVAQWGLLSCTIFFALAIDILKPFFGKKPHRTYWQRRRALQKAKERKNRRTEKNAPNARFLNRSAMPAFTAILWSILLIVSLGRFYARMETTHFIPQDAPSLVLVAARSDTLVFKAWDHRTGMLQDTLVIRNIAENGETRLVLQRTGSLKQAPYPPEPSTPAIAKP